MTQFSSHEINGRMAQSSAARLSGVTFGSPSLEDLPGFAEACLGEGFLDELTFDLVVTRSYVAAYSIYFAEHVGNEPYAHTDSRNPFGLNGTQFKLERRVLSRTDCNACRSLHVIVEA